MLWTMKCEGRDEPEGKDGLPTAITSITTATEATLVLTVVYLYSK